ncbi:MAG TPA: ATP-dependent DNA ligase [Usitatibacter sp.]|nr:ATP-dependent DNA ligase [Usitatibacter sp.]
MKTFAALYTAIDSTTSTKAKTDAMAEYFAAAQPRDAAWAMYFLTGHKPRQAVPTKRLHLWSAEAAGLPLWLFEESYDAVGDLAETIALVLPPPATGAPDLRLHAWIEDRILPLRNLPEAEQRERLMGYWAVLTREERFVFNKLITGALRVGVSELLVTRALAAVSGVDAKVISHRLMGDWSPTEEMWHRVVTPGENAVDRAHPYPFFLAHPLDVEPQALGNREDWLAEWKWDGIRAQLIRRGDTIALWSRGDESIAGQFPEIVADAPRLPDCVIDGEILAWMDGRVMPFAALQKRLGRKNPGKKVMAESPVIFLAFDLLELGGEDWRERPLVERRAKLHEIVHSIPGGSRFDTSGQVRAPSWETLAIARSKSREEGTEGLMLKRRDSPYGVGRPKGTWWKWKVEPYTLDAVLIYAQQGSGKRASLFTDYTFGLWKGEELVPFAKAYSGLTDEEIRQVDAFIRKNTLERFGPVRTVKPELVFELGFEGIQRSARHKSGIAVRFPRMLRMRTDKPAREANTVDDALGLAGLK